MCWIPAAGKCSLDVGRLVVKHSTKQYDIMNAPFYFWNFVLQDTSFNSVTYVTLGKKDFKMNKC